MITITKIPIRPNYYLITLLQEWCYLTKDAAAFVINSNAVPLYVNIECEEPAVRNLKANGFEVFWDKASWTKDQWEQYTNETCQGCINRDKSPCPNPFHKPTVKKEKK